jgi:uncharacterized RDD family membrane protein YckC
MDEERGELTGGRPLAASDYETPAELAAWLAPAGMGRRIIATLIDGFIVATVGAILTLRDGSDGTGWLGLANGPGLLNILFQIAYYVWPYSTGGQTVGKKLTHIRVVAIDGSSLNWRKGIARFLGTYLSVIPLGLGYLWAFFDKDRQAWHDKLAGTMVVHEDDVGDRPPLVPEEARRRQRRWLVALGALALALGLCFVVLFSATLLMGGSEIQRMAPWPGDLPPAEVIPPDLSALGLGTPTFFSPDQQGSMWQDFGYEDGVVAVYDVRARDALIIAALRYSGSRSAGSDFESMTQWAKENCGLYFFKWTGPSAGFINCTLNDAYNQTFWNGDWIIDVFVTTAASPRPQDLIDEVRDAIAEHWRTLPNDAPAQ